MLESVIRRSGKDMKAHARRALNDGNSVYTDEGDNMFQFEEHDEMAVTEDEHKGSWDLESGNDNDKHY